MEHVVERNNGDQVIFETPVDKVMGESIDWVPNNSFMDSIIAVVLGERVDHHANEEEGLNCYLHDVQVSYLRLCEMGPVLEILGVIIIVLNINTVSCEVGIDQ